MPTLNDYFREEARDFLTAVERSLEHLPAPDTAELHRAVRGLRGTAQLAREQRIFQVVSSFETVTRSLADGAMVWSDRVAAGVRDTVADLRALLEGAEDDETQEARVQQASTRWSGASAAAPPTAAEPRPTQPGTAGPEFHEYVAREAADIADALDRGIQRLQTDPMDRDALRDILRRQRALLGAARLEDLPVVADILRAVEDLTRVIAKLDVGVKQEWLDIYRVARDALQTTIAPLLRGETPEPSHSISRLRHMRAELLERYGRDADSTDPAAALGAAAAPAGPPAAEDDVIELGAEDIVATHDDVIELGSDAVVESAPPELILGAADIVRDGEPGRDPDPHALEASEIEATGETHDGAVAIDALAYTPESALKRALELKEVIERCTGDDPEARAAMDELFDLIRIALA